MDVNFEETLDRVIFHELGHLCVVEVLLHNFPQYYLEQVNFNYRQDSVGEYDWEGLVDTHLDDIEVKTNWRLAIVKLIGSVAGCAFETYHFNKLMKDDNAFENCFCLFPMCHGKRDALNFFEIHQLHALAFKEIGGTYIFTELRKILLKEEQMMNLLKKLATKEKHKILKRFEDDGSPRPFFYAYTNEELDLLREEIKKHLAFEEFNKMYGKLCLEVESRLLEINKL